MNVEKDETLEDLCLDGLKIIQNKNLYRFTSDAVILSNFVNAKPSDRLLDLCTGSGIIALLATYKNNLTKTIGIELQTKLAEMANRTLEFNNLQERITIINKDIQEIESLHLGEFDIITCNPPYKKLGTSKFNQNESQTIARHETTINLRQICLIAKKFLKFKGKFYICQDADRTAELMYELKMQGLEPKKMFFTQSSLTTKANIVFVEAVKGGKESVKILPMLITNDKDGKYIETVKKMKF